MRFIILILTFVAGHMLFFFVLSTIGLLWIHSYKAIISDPGWFVFYSMFFGVWIGFIFARSYYLLHERYFARLF